MKDDNWELIDGDTAHDIEFLNYANQINVIEALVKYYIHHHGVGDAGCPECPDIPVLRELHRTATLFLLSMPGHFRTVPVFVQSLDGTVVHTPPNYDEIEKYMAIFFDEIRKKWLEYDAVQIASYTLWMVNWVHPFKNGNGRSARAFCYACMSLKLGFVLPGRVTVIDLIMQQRDDYQSALRMADATFHAVGKPDLEPMNAFIERLLTEQFLSIDVTPSK
jgi:Fic family protein